MTKELTPEEIEAEAMAFVTKRNQTPALNPPESGAIPQEAQTTGPTGDDAPGNGASEPPIAPTPGASAPTIPDAAALAKTLEEERARRAEAQKAFLKAQDESARQRRELEDLRNQLEQVRTKVEGSLPDPEDAEYQKALDELKAVSPETVTVLERHRKNSLSVEQVRNLAKAVIEEERKTLSKDAEQALKESNWRRVIAERMPDYFEHRDSGAYEDWYTANKNRIKRDILAGYDNLDPEGGLKLMEIYLEETGRKKRETPTSAPEGTGAQGKRIAHIAGSMAPRTTPASKPPANPDDPDAVFNEAVDWIKRRRMKGA